MFATNFRITCCSAKLETGDVSPSPHFNLTFVSNASVTLLLTLTYAAVWYICRVQRGCHLSLNALSFSWHLITDSILPALAILCSHNVDHNLWRSADWIAYVWFFEIRLASLSFAMIWIDIRPSGSSPLCRHVLYSCSQCFRQFSWFPRWFKLFSLFVLMFRSKCCMWVSFLLSKTFWHSSSNQSFLWHRDLYPTTSSDVVLIARFRSYQASSIEFLVRLWRKGLNHSSSFALYSFVIKYFFSSFSGFKFSTSVDFFIMMWSESWWWGRCQSGWR